MSQGHQSGQQLSTGKTGKTGKTQGTTNPFRSHASPQLGYPNASQPNPAELVSQHGTGTGTGEVYLPASYDPSPRVDSAADLLVPTAPPPEAVSVMGASRGKALACLVMLLERGLRPGGDGSGGQGMPYDGIVDRIGRALRFAIRSHSGKAAAVLLGRAGSALQAWHASECSASSNARIDVPQADAAQRHLLAPRGLMRLAFQAAGTSMLSSELGVFCAENATTGGPENTYGAPGNIGDRITNGAAQMLGTRAVVGVRIDQPGGALHGSAMSKPEAIVSAWTCGLIGACICRGAEASAVAGHCGSWDSISSAVQAEGGLPSCNALRSSAADAGDWKTDGNSTGLTMIQGTGGRGRDHDGSSGSSSPVSLLSEEETAGSQTRALRSMLALAKRVHTSSRTSSSRSGRRPVSSSSSPSPSRPSFSYPRLVDFHLPVLVRGAAPFPPVASWLATHADGAGTDPAAASLHVPQMVAAPPPFQAILPEETPLHVLARRVAASRSASAGDQWSKVAGQVLRAAAGKRAAPGELRELACSLDGAGRTPAGLLAATAAAMRSASRAADVAVRRLAADSKVYDGSSQGRSRVATAAGMAAAQAATMALLTAERHGQQETQRRHRDAMRNMLPAPAPASKSMAVMHVSAAPRRGAAIGSTPSPAPARISMHLVTPEGGRAVAQGTMKSPGGPYARRIDLSPLSARPISREQGQGQGQGRAESWTGRPARNFLFGGSDDGSNEAGTRERTDSGENDDPHDRIGDGLAALSELSGDVVDEGLKGLAMCDERTNTEGGGS